MTPEEFFRFSRFVGRILTAINLKRIRGCTQTKKLSSYRDTLERSGLTLSGILSLPLIEELVPGGIDYATVLLVEFEPHSLWYDAAFTIASQAVRKGIKTDLHLLQHSVLEARNKMSKLGVDVRKLQVEDLLRFIDSYTVQMGLGSAEKPKGADAFKTESVRISDWAKAAGEQIQQGIADSEKHRLHIDDNLTVMTRYNKEDELIDFWRTRIIPLYRARESVLVHPLAVGVASDVFFKQFEALSDGIIDFRSREENGKIEHYVRLRTIQGKAPDTRWQHLLKSSNGLVSLDHSRPKVSELGIAGWLKGSKP